jgi:hypothetical protein
MHTYDIISSVALLSSSLSSCKDVRILYRFQEVFFHLFGQIGDIPVHVAGTRYVSPVIGIVIVLPAVGDPPKPKVGILVTAPVANKTMLFEGVNQRR